MTLAAFPIRLDVFKGDAQRYSSIRSEEHYDRHIVVPHSREGNSVLSYSEIQGMDRFEVLAMSSCLPLIASKQYEYKYHFVCPFHVIAPYLFKSYFPGSSSDSDSPIDSAFPWLQDVHEENVIVTAEFRDVMS